MYYYHFDLTPLMGGKDITNKELMNRFDNEQDALNYVNAGRLLEDTAEFAIVDDYTLNGIPIKGVLETYVIDGERLPMNFYVALCEYIVPYRETEEGKKISEMARKMAKDLLKNK